MVGTPETRDGVEGVPGSGPLAALGRYSTIVLVANSDAVDMDRLRREHGEAALFVFFNKVFKVLDAPFDGPCVLLARSSPAGANIVHRGEVATVLALMGERGFHGVLNLCADAGERFSPTEAFGGVPAAALDLAEHFTDFYPNGYVPTSGFALAIWLRDRYPAARVVLAGFSATRSARWKLFEDHDWTFEQVTLRALARNGSLVMAGGVREAQLSAIRNRFPELEEGELALIATEALADRLDGTNAMVDRLISYTRVQARLRAAWSRLRPRTRKERLAARKAAADAGH